MAPRGTEVWDESCHRLQEDSSSLRVSCPTTGTLIVLELILTTRKDILHLLQVHPCAILRLHLFSLCIYDSGLFLYLDEDEAMTLTGMLAQGKSLQRFPEIFHLKLDFLMMLDDREQTLISDWFKVLGDVSHFLERGAEMRVFLWTLKYCVRYEQESIRLAFSKKALFINMSRTHFCVNYTYNNLYITVLLNCECEKFSMNGFTYLTFILLVFHNILKSRYSLSWNTCLICVFF